MRYVVPILACVFACACGDKDSDDTGTDTAATDTAAEEQIG